MEIHEHVYEHPEYYEIGFSFRDVVREVDIIVKSIDLYSRIAVRRVLELACGPSPHMLELMKRGLDYIGLDLSEQMLEHARAKAHRGGFSPTLIKGDMNRFDLPEPVDFAYVLLGSLYARNSAELIAHFDAVRKSLKPGGLYFLDWCVEFTPLSHKAERWTIESDHGTVETSYAVQWIDPIAQTFDEVITLTVHGEGASGAVPAVFQEKHRRRAVYPQEFLLLIEKTGFEFIGWWNNWNFSEPLQEGMRPAEKKIERPIILIRKR